MEASRRKRILEKVAYSAERLGTNRYTGDLPPAEVGTGGQRRPSGAMQFFNRKDTIAKPYQLPSLREIVTGTPPPSRQTFPLSTKVPASSTQADGRNAAQVASSHALSNAVAPSGLGGTHTGDYSGVNTAANAAALGQFGYGYSRILNTPRSLNDARLAAVGHFGSSLARGAVLDATAYGITRGGEELMQRYWTPHPAPATRTFPTTPPTPQQNKPILVAKSTQ